MSSEPNPVRRRSLRTPSDLIAAGLATEAERPALDRVADRTAIALTPAVVELIDAADPADPVARQFVPSAAELTTTPEERGDPIGDAAYSPVKGIVHRYPDRVLLKPIMVCPVYCRFCFRREAVGDADGSLSAAELDEALAYVAGRQQVREIVVTGGDPLMLPPNRLAELVARVARISHVEVLRFHSRIPVAEPDRITPVLAGALRPPPESDLAVWVSVHVNHAREVSPAARQGLRRLAEAGLPLVSQTVLLKGVNDSAETLEDLFRVLVRNRVRPYYLHHPDLARGTSHFRLSIAEGQEIVRQLRGRLTGIAQPTYVLDIPGGAGKVPLTPEFWDGERGQVRDWQGRRHVYPPK